MTHARRRQGKVFGASGPNSARSTLPELRGGGGIRRARGRRGLLQRCNAALRRELSPRPGALHRCCNAGVSAAPGGRAEPGHAVQAPPGRPPFAPPRASALPCFLAPVSFFSRSCRVCGTCPPAVGHRQPPSPRPCARRGGGSSEPTGRSAVGTDRTEPPSFSPWLPPTPRPPRSARYRGWGRAPGSSLTRSGVSSRGHPSHFHLLCTRGASSRPRSPLPATPLPPPLLKQRCLYPVFLYRSSAPRRGSTREHAALGKEQPRTRSCGHSGRATRDPLGGWINVIKSEVLQRSPMGTGRITGEPQTREGRGGHFQDSGAAVVPPPPPGCDTGCAFPSLPF